MPIFSTNNLYEFDNSFLKQPNLLKSPNSSNSRETNLATPKTLIGTDEAGRGCLAGDVFAAAVVLDNVSLIEGLNDSKKLSKIKREHLYGEIISLSRAYSIKTATVAEIEQLNILNASLLAMKRACEEVMSRVNSPYIIDYIILVDGNRLPPFPDPISSVAIINGDGQSASIAAASILAKVARDEYMQKLDHTYPGYYFSKHKGYATKLHREMILEKGPSPAHRISFLKNISKRGQA